MNREPTEDEIEAACAEQERRYEDAADGGSEYWREAEAETDQQVPGGAYIHVTGWWQGLLESLRIKVPRALCGESLIAQPGEPELGPDAPVCPACLWYREPWYTAVPPFSWLFGGCEDAWSNFTWRAGRPWRLARRLLTAKPAGTDCGPGLPPAREDIEQGAEPYDATAERGPYCGACGHPARPGDPLVAVTSARVPIHYSHVTDPESGFCGEQVTSPACTECGTPLRLRDHDGKDHVDCAAGREAS